MKKDKSEKELKALCVDQLDVFLQKGKILSMEASVGSLDSISEFLLSPGFSAFDITISWIKELHIRWITRYNLALLLDRNMSLKPTLKTITHIEYCRRTTCPCSSSWKAFM